jgi:hypothetical protein
MDGNFFLSRSAAPWTMSLIKALECQRFTDETEVRMRPANGINERSNDTSKVGVLQKGCDFDLNKIMLHRPRSPGTDRICLRTNRSKSVRARKQSERGGRYILISLHLQWLAEKKFIRIL